MAVLTDVGGAYIANLMNAAAGGWYVAWGEGDAAWDDTPVEPEQDDTALEDHLGHLVATAKFVVPDAGGAITTASGEKWSLTASAGATPSRYIYLEAPYDYTDAPTAVIRELAVYKNATPDTGHEAQSYLPVADLASLGTLITIERITAVARSESISGKFKVVVRIGEEAE